MPEDSQQLTLADVAASFTAIDDSYQQFHGKLFSYIPPDTDRFANFLAELRIGRKMFPNNHPATVIVGHLAPIIPTQTKQVMSVENGQPRILFELSDAKLPDCDYLAARRMG